MKKRRMVGLLTAAYDRDVTKIVSAFTKAIREVPDAGLPQLERLFADFLIGYVDNRTADATDPHWSKALRELERSREGGRKGERMRTVARKLPEDGELLAQLKEFMRTRGEREARSVIQNRYRGVATRQAINKALRRARTPE